ncbi:glycosyltransferase [Mariniflexile aquimaris]|uniref:Glycosyltransferase n=1 Tax=Mariniflexile aquimaris TaxID=881009 RepID=A0ABW3BRK9_9FLAO
MKVLQLIDSLHAGGAERLAVNYANALSPRIEKSYLCATREEGLLKDSISKDVEYLFLNKKSTFDFKAINKLFLFIKTNRIDIIHAHSSSFFLATIIRILNPKIDLIWHEHYGNRAQTSIFNKFVLKSCSYFFSSIITANNSLKSRSEKKLVVKKVYVLPNYPVIDASLKTTRLHGVSNKRIICLANLRTDKDHINLLNAFFEVRALKSDWTLHLVGHYNEDDYYKTIKKFILQQHLENHVFIYGSRPDVYHILSQSAIGVLASKSEGLPVALLEYGLAKLPVVATNVGDCKNVISNNAEGILVDAQNSKELAEALLVYINDLDLRNKVAENLHLKVMSTFSETNVMKSLLNIYKNHQK